MLNEALAIQVEEVNDLVIIREELVSEDNLASRQSYELAVGTVSDVSRASRRPMADPKSVHFTHAAPQDLRVHRRLFGLM